MERPEENPFLEIFDDILSDPERGDHFKTDTADVVILGKKPDEEIMVHIRTKQRGITDTKCCDPDIINELKKEYEGDRDKITFAERGNLRLANKFLTWMGLNAWRNEDQE